MQKEELAKYLDLANHHPDATTKDVMLLCRKVLRYGFHTAFINPYYVKLAKSIIKNNAAVGTVVSFPLGQETLEMKILAAKQAARNGADELDVSMNVGKFKEGAYSYVKNELYHLVVEPKKIKKSIVVKFIIETGCLTEQEIIKASKLVLQSGADFVKTCSGYGPRGATIKDVLLIRKAVGNAIKLKVAGGITNTRQALAFIGAGADRIGSSHTIEILEGLAVRGKKGGE